MKPVCLVTRQYPTQQLFADHPPAINFRNKQVVYEIACPVGCRHSGDLQFSRWQALPLANTVNVAEWQTELVSREDSFGYEPVQQHGMQEWYLNFANWDLFSDYGGPLLAQDEHQVAEHPALGALREALLSEGVPFNTKEDDEPTPILIRDVERRCILDTQVNVKEGRPYGLYGIEFARAHPDEIRKAVKTINPPTKSNILAIEAPADGAGAYVAETVLFILKTAYSGFSAARHESIVNCQAQSVSIHTGFWGCGAYGGNRVMMAALQLVAANMAKIDQLVFHTFSESGTEDLQQATSYLRNILPSVTSMDDLITSIVNLHLVWGTSDGN